MVVLQFSVIATVFCGQNNKYFGIPKLQSTCIFVLKLAIKVNKTFCIEKNYIYSLTRSTTGGSGSGFLDSLYRFVKD